MNTNKYKLVRFGHNWNVKIMEYWVLGKMGMWNLVKSSKTYPIDFPYRPIFHYSID